MEEEVERQGGHYSQGGMERGHMLKVGQGQEMGYRGGTEQPLCQGLGLEVRRCCQTQSEQTESGGEGEEEQEEQSALGFDGRCNVKEEQLQPQTKSLNANSAVNL